MEERESQRILPERRLADLLNETFAIYGRHFRHIVILIAIVQVPISILTLIFSDNIAGILVVGAISIASNGIVYGGVAFAVVQNYINKQIELGLCFRRISWRLLSLVLLSLIPAVMLTAVLGLVMVDSPLAGLLVVPLIGLIIYLVYWTIAVPSVIIEGQKTVGALKRSIELVRGSWWRVFGLSLVFGLVAVGLGILVNIPFFIAISLTAPEPGQTNILSTAFEFMGSLAASIIVPPVILIGGTLIYYDLRVRKESYDFEMPIQGA